MLHAAAACCILNLVAVSYTHPMAKTLYAVFVLAHASMQFWLCAPISDQPGQIWPMHACVSCRVVRLAAPACTALHAIVVLLRAAHA